MIRPNPFIEIGTPDSDGIYINVNQIAAVKWDKDTKVYLTSGHIFTAYKDSYHEILQQIDDYYQAFGDRDHFEMDRSRYD